MDPKEFKELMDGDTVQFRQTSDEFMVTGNYGARVIVVRTVDITNPIEWITADQDLAMINLASLKVGQLIYRYDPLIPLKRYKSTRIYAVTTATPTYAVAVQTKVIIPTTASKWEVLAKVTERDFLCNM